MFHSLIRYVILNDVSVQAGVDLSLDYEDWEVTSDATLAEETVPGFC